MTVVRCYFHYHGVCSVNCSSVPLLFSFSIHLHLPCRVQYNALCMLCSTKIILFYSISSTIHLAYTTPTNLPYIWQKIQWKQHSIQFMLICLHQLHNEEWMCEEGCLHHVRDAKKVAQITIECFFFNLMDSIMVAGRNSEAYWKLHNACFIIEEISNGS
jgi:hypothetical protein